MYSRKVEKNLLKQNLQFVIKICVIQKIGNLGALIAKIQDADFKVTGLKLHHFTPTEAEEFFIAYKGVWNDYLVILNLNNLFSIVVRCTKLRFLLRLTLNNSPRDPSSPYASMPMSIVSGTLLVLLTRYYQTFITDTRAKVRNLMSVFKIGNCS